MKHHLLLALLLVSIASFAQSGDTVYRTISIYQSDSLIQTNQTNPDFIIIDVRTPTDFNTCHINGAINMNYYDADFNQRLTALDHSKFYLIYCQSGTRSGKVFTTMQTDNFKTVYNMNGGFGSYKSAGLSEQSCMLTAIQNTSDNQDAQLYFNNNDLVIFNLKQGSTLFLYDLTGIVVSETFIASEYQTTNLSLPNGIYIYRNEELNGKVVKR